MHDLKNNICSDLNQSTLLHAHSYGLVLHHLAEKWACLLEYNFS